MHIYWHVVSISITGNIRNAKQPLPRCLPQNSHPRGHQVGHLTGILSNQSRRLRYDHHHYSVPSVLAGKHVSLRAYADRIVVVSGHTVVAEHPRGFSKQGCHFEFWHYVPLLARKPNALRNGAPFKQWPLPAVLETLKQRYLKRAKGDRDMVQLLLLIQTHGMDAVITAFELALEEKTTHLSAIINLVHRLTEENTQPTIDASSYPELQHPPIANCHRYDQLRGVAVCDAVTGSKQATNVANCSAQTD